MVWKELWSNNFLLKFSFDNCFLFQHLGLSIRENIVPLGEGKKSNQYVFFWTQNKYIQTAKQRFMSIKQNDTSLRLTIEQRKNKQCNPLQHENSPLQNKNQTVARQ